MAPAFTTWWQRNGLLASLFAPPALWVAVRWWLNFQLERSGLTLPPALSPASDPDSVMRWLWGGGAVALALGVLVWWLMRPSTAGTAARRWVGRGLLVLWVLAWVGGAAQTQRSHANRLGLQPARQVVLKVVAVQVQPASVRSVGGAKVYLDWPEGGGLHTVLLESPTEDLLRQPAALALTVAAGRWSGEFVTGWRVDNAAAPTTPKPAP
jgi:hypothetical protein